MLSGRALTGGTLGAVLETGSRKVNNFFVSKIFEKSTKYVLILNDLY